MLEKTKTVLCRCRYCGRDFLADSRHPHASCCVDAECVRARALQAVTTGD